MVVNSPCSSRNVHGDSIDDRRTSTSSTACVHNLLGFLNFGRTTAVGRRRNYGSIKVCRVSRTHRSKSSLLFSSRPQHSKEGLQLSRSYVDR